MMGFIAFVMLIAGGYAAILKETGAVNSLIEGVVPLMGESKWVAATIITLIGLLVTMGIGTSFGTVPILAVIYVPLCTAVGFSVPATILLMTIAGALGDAGSPPPTPRSAQRPASTPTASTTTSGTPACRPSSRTT